MNGFHWLLDENVGPNLRQALHDVFPEMTVWIVGDPGTPDYGTRDPAILQWCDENYFALVTNNRSTMPVHLQNHIAAGGHIPGIFILHPEMSMGETVDDLALIWDAAEPDEFLDQIVYLPL
jgi:hypothetical protein